MGYSGRYHAASLAAVFLALAVGILIGVGFGSDVVTGTAESLEESLGSELTETRERTEELEAELQRERDFAQRLYPAIVGGRLAGERAAIVALGGLPEELSRAVEVAIDPAGASLAEIAVVAVPPSRDAIVEALLGAEGRRFSRREALRRAAVRAGKALGTGGQRFEDVRRSLLSRYSGEPGFVNDVVVFRQVPEDLEDGEAEGLERFEAGLIEGLEATGATVVGVERSDEETSSTESYQRHGIASVDSVDTLAGRVALVFTLGGAEGSFGTKETADRLIPDLLPPPIAPPTRAP